jgi:tRNA nucleotidyltransferase (CCA-adding enzyme)
MRQMVAAGEADALVPERVWQEFARGLMEARPSRMFHVLCDCEALGRVAPELGALFASPDVAGEVPGAVDAAATAGCALEVRFAALARTLDPLAVEALCGRVKVPAACRDLALLAARHRNTILDGVDLDAEALLELFDATDAWRRPDRFGQLLTAALVAVPEAQVARCRIDRALAAATAVNAGEIAGAAGRPEEIRRRIREARLAAIRSALDR